MYSKLTLQELQVLHIKAIFADVAAKQTMTPSEEYISGIELPIYDESIIDLSHYTVD